MLAAVVGEVLDADQPRLRPPEVPPLGHAREHRPLLGDAPEEVVRREEHQVAAEVAVPLDRVVLARRHVLAVPGVDDEVVRLRQLVAGERFDVRLGKEVDRLLRPVEPVQEPLVVAVEERGNAAVEIRAVKGRALVRRPGVPRVAPAVAVGVPEVVRLPGVGREDDGDARGGAELRRPDHERCVADRPVRRGELDEVQTRRPGTDRKADRVRLVAAARPVDRRGLGHRHALEQVVGVGDEVLGAGPEHLQLQARRVGRDPERAELVRSEGSAS